MSRDDSLLNTGMSSALDRKLEAKKKLERDTRKETLQRIIPGSELILEMIDKYEAEEMDKLSKMLFKLDDPEGRILQRLEALQLNIAFVRSLKSQFDVKLREIPTNTPKQEETWDYDEE